MHACQAGSCLELLSLSIFSGLSVYLSLSAVDGLHNRGLLQLAIEEGTLTAP